MKKKLLKPEDLPLPIAIVIWEDSHESSEEWDDPYIYDNPEERSYFIATVGWVIKDDDLGVVMSAEYSKEDEVKSPLVIPRSAVRYTQYLK